MSMPMPTSLFGEILVEEFDIDSEDADEIASMYMKQMEEKLIEEAEESE